MWEVFKALNLSNYVERLENWELQTLRNEKVNFEITKKAPILFERFE
jgi:hypothetical protein